MGVDEEGTLAQLKASRKSVIDPAIAEHKGRIVKTTGDGMLVEFASSVDAVRCAIEIQEKMAARSASGAEARIVFRIGINVGDIIIDGDDIFGDGVNVAARVESECEPGGVCVSGNAFEQIRGKTNFTFDDLGEKTLKNIERPVRLYAVRGATSAAKTTTATAMPSDNSRPLPLPDKPSIAVLPFQNMSGDPEQEYFADGMVEDIITALSRKKGLFVIARNSTFFYKGRQFDIRQVGRELGVRYVLEGSVRKAGGKVRITGQLIEAATGAHLWADKFDGVLDDIFDLQDRITVGVVTAISPQLLHAEIERAKRKPPEDLTAYDYYLQGLSAFYRNTKSETFAAKELWLRAVKADPTFAPAWANLANWHNRVVTFGWTTNRDQHAREGVDAARRALALDKDDPDVLARAGSAIGFFGGLSEEGLALVDESIGLDPNLAFGWAWSGRLRSHLGDHDGAIERSLHSIRLSPRDSLRFVMMTTLGHSHFFKGQYDAASSWVREGLRLTPGRLWAHRVLVASSALAGHTAETHESLQTLQSLWPGSSVSDFLKINPFHLSADRERMVEGLRLAGMPE